MRTSTALLACCAGAALTAAPATAFLPRVASVASVASPLAPRSSAAAGVRRRATTLDPDVDADAVSQLEAKLTESSTGAAAAPVVVEVGLGDRAYPIYIGDNLMDEADGGALLRKHVTGQQVLVVTNDNIDKWYLDKYVNALKEDPNLKVESFVIPDGEEHKTMDVIMSIMQKALECRLDRKATFVALGGGVVGDMVGFASAIYQRGVNFIQVPTTVMAMVDSSVGGKTGCNHPLGKNMIGAFYQPQAVLIDTATLNTLPDREYCSGLSEVIKYGLIRDADFFKWQEENMDKLMARDPASMITMIQRSCENKAEVVAQDEREGGVRATLNLGHTFGHAVETGLGYGEWLHGEAVSVGTVMAVDMSKRLGWIDDELADRATALLKRANLPVALPEGCPLTVDDFRNTMAIDKKVANGVLRLILLDGELGGCKFTGEYDRKCLDETLEAFALPNEA